jgi:phosphopantetheinyl transferase
MLARSVDLYVADLRSVATDEELLSAAELGHALVIAFSPALNEYLAARTWVRRRLAEYLDCDPEAIRFESDAAGRATILAPETDLTFSLGYAGRVAVLAVGFRRNVGVSVLATADVELDDGLVERVLAPPEKVRFERALNPVRAFQQFRVRKEALTAASGSYAESTLDSIDVSGLSPITVDGMEITDIHVGDDLVASVAAPLGSVVNLRIDDTVGGEPEHWLEPRVAVAE